MTRTFVHIGRIYYNASSASPIIVGDFEVMKGWRGDPDGMVDDLEMRIDSGPIVGLDFDQIAPDLFFAAPDAVVLMTDAKKDRSLLKTYSIAELQGDLIEPAQETYESCTVDIPSGALAITIAYNATPEVGADTSGLDPLCFHEDTTFLPKAIPTTPLYSSATNKADIAVVPVTAGKYSFTVARTKREFLRCTIGRT